MSESYRYFPRSTSFRLPRLRAALPWTIAATLLCGVAEARFDLTILHTNDLHSRIEPVNAYNTTCNADADGACFGGIARVKALIDRRRAEIEADGGAVLVLDAGDQFQGSLFYTTYKGAAAAEFMNAIGYDAMALGNHEFDDGPENLARFVSRLEFPVISTNIDTSRSDFLAGLIAPHAVVARGGERIGIVAGIAEDTPETSSPGPDVVFEQVETAFSRAVAYLGSIGIDKIIVLNHVGLRRDLEIAAKLDGIDAIIGGHSHSLLSNSEPKATGSYPMFASGAGGRRVPVAHAYAYSRIVGELRLTFDDDGAVIEAIGAPHSLDATIAPDAGIARRVSEMIKPFDTLRKQVVGTVSAPVDASHCRHDDCEMGILIAEAMLARTRRQGVQVVIINGGGLRASFDAGEVTVEEVLTVLPFQNTLATFGLSGAGIVDALENGVSEAERGAGRFPQVAGIRYRWNPDNDLGNRIVDIEVRGDRGWMPLEPARTYLVASNDYLRRGGDGYAVFRDRAIDAYDYGDALDAILTDYLATKPEYRPFTDDRIRRVR
ncbi:MAG: multifunctional 2',3'-cyclic-nucleotide 2'-phosphodiesterase/5'-nucleotidase/3'-nucleotidase [Proteobacteria bacterium]|nr:MAG: multifunctional 2',3'-cyclic-nucleotide 2'-phosphodiesterase/5'-nucleotidase/3'-nucleotidase [Pseudomonadota bacterium]